MGLVIRHVPASLRRDLCSQSPSPKLKPPRRRLARVWAERATPRERGLGYVHRAQRVLNGVSGSRYVVMQRQRSVSTIRQPLMSTAVTFAALTESGRRSPQPAQSRHHGLPGDGYHGHAL